MLKVGNFSIPILLSNYVFYYLTNHNRIMLRYILLLLAIVFETIATSFLKQSEQFSKLWPTVMMVVCYGASFYFLSIVLKTMPIGIAYAIWSGVGIVLIGFIGWLVFKQSLDFPAILGMGMIIVGVIIINLFSKSVLH